MLRPTSRLASGRSFAASMARWRLAMEISPNPSSPRTWSQSIGEHVADVVDEPELEEEADGALAEALDVERAPRREVLDRTVDLVRALEVDAAGVALALGPHQRAPARARAGGRERPRLGALRPVGQHRADDLGDHVAGPAHDHRVARPHVLGPHLVLVVQGRLARRWRRRRTPARAGRTGVARPVRPDRHEDVEQLGGPLLGRELVGDRPPRRPAGEAELAAPAEVVDLHDHAVDLVVEVVAVLLPPLAVRLHLVEVRQHGDLGVHRQAGRRAGSRASRGGW